MAADLLHGDIGVAGDRRHALDLAVSGNDEQRGAVASELSIVQGFVAKSGAEQNDRIDLALIGVEYRVDVIVMVVDVDQDSQQPFGLQP